MSIDKGIAPIDRVIAGIEPLAPRDGADQPRPVGESFVSILRGQMDELVALQDNAAQMQQALAAGQIDDLSQVVHGGAEGGPGAELRAAAAQQGCRGVPGNHADAGLALGQLAAQARRGAVRVERWGWRSPGEKAEWSNLLHKCEHSGLAWGYGSARCSLAFRALLIIGILSALVLVINAPPVQAPLYRNLETVDAAHVVEELKKQEVKYELENEGRDIIVPAEPASTTCGWSWRRMGLPQRAVGFELFDKPKLGITEQGMQIDKQRALQGELVRTLESLEPVAKASVLLNISPESSFLDVDTRSPRPASRCTRTAGRTLSEAQVQGIKLLVSRAVPRLSEDDVSVVDGNGNPLTGRRGQLALRAAAGRDADHRPAGALPLQGGAQPGRQDPHACWKALTARVMSAHRSRWRSISATSTMKARTTSRWWTTRASRSASRSTARNRPAARRRQAACPGTTSNIPGYLGIAAEREPDD